MWDEKVSTEERKEEKRSSRGRSGSRNETSGRFFYPSRWLELSNRPFDFNRFVHLAHVQSFGSSLGSFSSEGIVHSSSPAPLASPTTRMGKEGQWRSLSHRKRLVKEEEVEEVVVVEDVKEKRHTSTVSPPPRRMRVLSPVKELTELKGSSLSFFLVTHDQSGLNGSGDRVEEEEVEKMVDGRKHWVRRNPFSRSPFSYSRRLFGGPLLIGIPESELIKAEEEEEEERGGGKVVVEAQEREHNIEEGRQIHTPLSTPRRSMRSSSLSSVGTPVEASGRLGAADGMGTSSSFFVPPSAARITSASLSHREKRKWLQSMGSLSYYGSILFEPCTGLFWCWCHAILEKTPLTSYPASSLRLGEGKEKKDTKEADREENGICCDFCGWTVWVAPLVGEGEEVPIPPVSEDGQGMEEVRRTGGTTVDGEPTSSSGPSPIVSTTAEVHSSRHRGRGNTISERKREESTTTTTTTTVEKEEEDSSRSRSPPARVLAVASHAAGEGGEGTTSAGGGSSTNAPASLCSFLQGSRTAVTSVEDPSVAHEAHRRRVVAASSPTPPQQLGLVEKEEVTEGMEEHRMRPQEKDAAREGSDEEGGKHFFFHCPACGADFCPSCCEDIRKDARYHIPEMVLVPLLGRGGRRPAATDPRGQRKDTE